LLQLGLESPTGVSLHELAAALSASANSPLEGGGSFPGAGFTGGPINGVGEGAAGSELVWPELDGSELEEAGVGGLSPVQTDDEGSEFASSALELVDDSPSEHTGSLDV
jgi:hypothetical protein